MFHLFCPLCGVVLSYHLDETPPPSPLDWDQEIRALSRTLDDDKPALSGVGFIQHDAYRANFDSQRPYTDPGPLETYELPSGPNPTTYLLHDACWKLLPRRAGALHGMQQREERIAELLFHLLQCIHKDKDGVPLTRHLFGGIAWHRDSYGIHTNGYQNSLKDDLQYVMADPRLDLEEEIRESRAKVYCQWQTPHGSAISGDYHDATNSQDPFKRLPDEIISLIINELFSGSVCNLRCASRAVASITSPPDLPQSFWGSRFSIPFEMAFFIAGEKLPVSSRDVDWRALYARVRSSLAAKAPGIRNRHRISQCYPVVCAALRPLLHKANSEWPPAEPKLAEHVLLEGCRLGRMVGSQTTLRYDAQYLPLSGLTDSSTVTITASFINFNCSFYLSGLKVTSPDENGDSRILHKIGINTSIWNGHVTLSQGTDVSGVRAHVYWGGVTSLEFLSGDKSLGILSLWNRTPLRYHTAVADLCARDSTRLDGLVVYLDICRCIALQAVEARSANDGSSTTNTAEFENATEPPCLPVWRPHAPPDEDIDLARPDGRGPHQPGVSPVLLNMDFGGPRGEKLGLLYRVVALVGGAHGLFKGLEFFYDDGTVNSYGSRQIVQDASTTRSCVEPSFVVCGRQGERIIEIRADKGMVLGSDHVKRLRFRTNMGSEHSFEMVGRHTLEGRLQEFAVLTPREGHVLTGLVTELTIPTFSDPFYETFGALGMIDAPRDDAVQGVASGDASAQMVPLQRAMEPYIRRKCCWSGVVNLQDVTRIEFSGGSQYLQPRDDRHVTGLMFHFRGSERVAIVGQWMHKVESMDIDDGDAITHIRFYYLQRSRRVSTLRKDRAKVSGIVVGTARGARKVVLGRECDETFHADYYANPLEVIDGISWGFYHENDRPLVENVPSPRAYGRALRLHESPKLHGRQNALNVPRQFLWTEVDSQGDDVRLSAIEAYFSPVHLSGLRFVYDRGVERSVGRCEGELATLRLAPTEKIGMMAVNMDSEGGDSLVFYTNIQEAVFLHHPNANVPLADTDYTRYQMDKDSIIWAPPSEAEALKTPREVEPPAGARECVGIRVVVRPSRPPKPSIRDVGPIFLEDPPPGE